MIHHRTQGSLQVANGLITVAVIAALLGLDAVLGMGRLQILGRQIQPHHVIVGIAVPTFMVLAFQHVEFGLLLLPVVAVAVPFAIGTGTQSQLMASLAYAAFLLTVWVSRLVISRDLTSVGSPINLPLAGFVLTAILATINSGAMWDPMVYSWASFFQAQMGGLGVLILSAGLLVMVMNSFRQDYWIKWVVWVFLAAGAITLSGYLLLSQTDIPGVSTGGLFSMWVVALAFGQALFNDRLSRWLRWVLIALAVAWIWRRFFFENGWLSGWVPQIVALLVISLLRSRSHFVLVVLGLGVVCLFNSAFVFAIYDQQLTGSDSGGNLLRLDLWEQNLQITEHHLLFGTGMAGYAPYYVTYFPERAMSTHSNYLDVFAQTGLIGSIFFVWFIVALWRVGFKVRRRWSSGFEAGFANGMLGGLAGLVVAMAFGDWLIPFVYNQTIAGFRYTVHSWILLGALAGLQHIKSD